MRRLRALRPLEVDERGLQITSFCGHCGMPPAANVESAGSRVCGLCGLGLVLQASSDIAPHADEPFLVIDSTLSVCAVSARAENLLVLLVDAASGSGAPRTAVVRPRQEFGVRFRARIGPCGPPRAALLVLTD